MHATAEEETRLPPNSIAAEQCAVGSMLLCGDRLDLLTECRAMLSPQSFFSPDCAIVFEVICFLMDAKKPIDSVLVREELSRRGLLDEIGGTAQLAALLNSVPDSSNATHYAALVREKHLLRSIIQIGTDAARKANPECAFTLPAMDIAQTAIARLTRLGEMGASTHYVSARDAALRFLDSLDDPKSPLLRSGIDAIDRDIGGLRPGESMVIGARPSMGKSTVARQMAFSAARNGTPVAYISLEESRGKLMQNMISAMACVPNGVIRARAMNAEQAARLNEAGHELSTLPIYIADKAFTVDAIRAVASAMIARHGCRILILDYLQLVRVRGANRYEQVTQASAEIVSLIREMAVAGVVLAQLNRETARRENRRPTMTDLRDSGQIEQDADVILLLHREDYYRATGEAEGPADGVAELIKAKFRDGCRGGTIRLRSNLECQRFDELAADPWGDG